MIEKTTTAALLAKLQGDQKYRANKEERDEALRQKSAEYALAEAPLIAELRLAGVPVSSVWDLVNAGKRPARTFRVSGDPSEALWRWLDSQNGSYESILPILLDHLHRPYPDRVRAGIARALAIREARFAWPLLVKLYTQELGTGTREGLAIALANIADDGVIDELIALAGDPQHGMSRVLLFDALQRSRLPVARTALMNFTHDPLVQKEAQRVLRELSKN